MSRVAKAPVRLASGVTADIGERTVTVKGPRGVLTLEVHPTVAVQREDGELRCAPRDAQPASMAQAATTRALLNNMATGVSQGFERKLELVGVGYRVQVTGRQLSLALGYSHPIVFDVPEGITVEAPSQTEVVVKGVDKQMVGQVAAKIRGLRPPEPYKGKGVRYAGEAVVRKEAKKK